MPLLGILKKYTDTVSEDHSYTWIRSTKIYYILLQCLQQNKVTISYPSSCSISAQIYSKPSSDVAKSWASRTAEFVISVLSSFKKFQNNHKTIPLCWCCWSVSDLYNASNFRWVKVFGWVAPLMSDLSHLIALYILPWLWGLVKKFLTKNLLALTVTGISHVSRVLKRRSAWSCLIESAISKVSVQCAHHHLIIHNLHSVPVWTLSLLNGQRI
jgi:hypothetical protein